MPFLTPHIFTCFVEKVAMLESIAFVKLLMPSITPQKILPKWLQLHFYQPPQNFSLVSRKVLVSCQESNLLIKILLQNFLVLWRINPNPHPPPPTPISYSWLQKLINHNMLFQYIHWFNKCRLMLILFFFQDFGITICMSFISVLIAAVLYSLHVYRVRGHLFHFDRLLYSR